MEKNLHSAEAVAKYKSLVSAIGTCMFTTSGESGHHASRPMAIVDVDDDANTWFFTSLNSEKIKDIRNDQDVAMIFAHPGKEIYVDVKGRAAIITDRATMESKWNPIVKVWFPEGVDSPDICLLKVKTDEAHYWDSDSSKMMQAFKMLASVVTGQNLVKGVHGDLNL
ncbi:pyridoxamine 5'-phosphate oxidase family protein [Sediminibacterium ginsengisoli]|uniref:General stress protein 26 n=1 Tax=Sediminibacterium ginsengisoli TaxID=413434 RepID=A0A1T4Q1U9_9BACT|nr:pyridoxamine 5'-phosphate oxidase family protein [Sediminibacterium ginsengisoli]SJZ97753.1 General stress protein 26 [Sediminibacterium ginsengisoli]